MFSFTLSDWLYEIRFKAGSFLPLIASSFFVIVAVLFSPSFSLSLLVTLADKQV